MQCCVCGNDLPAGSKPTRKTCSTKCRSAYYRRRRAEPDSALKLTEPGPDNGEGPRERTTRPSSRRGPSESPVGESATWERLISLATDRIVTAIERRGYPSEKRSSTAWCVDMREQVLSQAPKEAAGYRLVLSPRKTSDMPRLCPKRSRTRDTAWYTLAPFEYPDDLRLRDSLWYRIVWVAAQGERIRMKAGEPVPGLWYFVGPHSVRGHLHKSAAEHQNPVSYMPHSPAPLLVTAVTPSTATEPPTLATAATAAAAMETPAPRAAASPTPPESQPMEEWKALLDSFPPLDMEHSGLLVNFVASPEYMIQLLYEERLAEAKASGRTAPKQPITSLSHKELSSIHAALTSARLPSHFTQQCKAVFAFLRRNGTDVLATLPLALFPLNEEQRRPIQHAASNPSKRTYARYVCAWQDARLADQPFPVEPNVNLSSKERNEIRKMMRDLRNVMLFQKLVKTPGLPV